MPKLQRWPRILHAEQYNTTTMKHDDATLQAAIDAAMLEIGEQVYAKNFAACPKYYRSAWPEEADDRLALAKAFLAKLPEPQPILADDGRSLGQVVHDILAKGFSWDRLLKGDQELCESAAQAVADVVLAQTIRRMEAVPVEEVAEIIRRQWLDRGGWIEPAAQAVRARLITAARGEPVAALTKLKSFLKP